MGTTETGLALPSFRNPPVVEVAMSFGFSPIDSLQFAEMADLRMRWLADYPEAQEQPFLEPDLPQQSIWLRIGPPPRRLWLIGADGDRLVQIQNDRLIANWRRLPGDNTPYPRYSTLREEFVSRWTDFNEFIEERLQGVQIRPQNAEVSYVNAITWEDGAPPSAIRDVLLVAGSSKLDEIGLVATNYVGNWQTADSRDRLVVSAALDSDAPASRMVVNITANAQIDETRSDDEALDHAHGLVVGTFGVITTQTMQGRWGRKS